MRDHTAVSGMSWRQACGRCPDVASPPVTTRSLDRGDSHRLRTFGSLFDLELDALIILERTMSAPTDLGVMDEQIFSTAVGSDKAKALIAVEPFDGSLCHISKPSHRADVENIRSQPTRLRVPISPWMIFSCDYEID